MGAVAVFDYPAWVARFPELSGSVPAATAQAYFNDAGLLYLNNQGGSPVADVPTQLSLLNLLVAHMAKLATQELVGRITNASQGSVSVTAAFDASGQPNAQWFLQTQYGAMFWQGTGRFRRARYIVARAPVRRQFW